MSVVVHRGDLLKQRECDVIVHCCNCFCTMGRGIAKAIREKYPEAYAADQQTERGCHAKLGTYTSARCSDGTLVVNLYAQFNYGLGGVHLDYGALEAGLDKLLATIKPRAIATYWLGCSSAGGEASAVGRIFRRLAAKHDTTFHVYEL